MKHVNDVRPLSADARYQGVVFQGKMKSALKQARNAPDHGVSDLSAAARAYMQKHDVSRDRVLLLQHLNLVPQS